MTPTRSHYKLVLVSIRGLIYTASDIYICTYHCGVPCQTLRFLNPTLGRRNPLVKHLCFRISPQSKGSRFKNIKTVSGVPYFF
uniref:Uncharacterized protein n=1 Tax=Arundo donax TaxID=35708 RepID=A0A0A9DIK2_ARUDO